MNLPMIKKVTIAVACLVAIGLSGLNLYNYFNPQPVVMPKPPRTHPSQLATTKPSRTLQVPTKLQLQPVYKRNDFSHNPNDYGLSDAAARTLNGHAGCVSALALSPDEKILASASSDGTVRLWDWKNSKLLKILEGISHDPMTTRFSSDGKLLAVGMRQGQVIVWQVDSGDIVAELTGHGDGVANLLFSQQNQQLTCVGMNGIVRTWDLPTEKQIAQVDVKNWMVMSAAFSQDGKWLLIGTHDGAAYIIDQEQHKIFKELLGNQNGIDHVGIVNNTIGILYHNNQQLFQLFDLQTGKEISTRKQMGYFPMASDVTPDGQTITMAQGLHITLWHPLNNQPEVLRLYGPESPLYATVISHDGRYIFAAGGESRENPNTSGQAHEVVDSKVYIWDLYFNSLIHSDHPSNALALSPDDQVLAQAGNDHIVKYYDTHTGNLLAQSPDLEAPIQDLSYQPNSSRLLVHLANGKLVLLDSDHKIQSQLTPTQPIQSAFWGHAGTIILQQGARIASWDASAPAEQTLIDCTSPIQKMAVSQEQPLAVVVCHNTPTLYDLTTRKLKSTITYTQPGTIEALSINPQGTTIILSDTHFGLFAYDVAKAEITQQWDNSDHIVNLIKMAPDGKTCFTLDHAQISHCWLVENGFDLHSIPDLKSPLINATFSHQNNTLYYLTKSGDTCSWQLTLGSPLVDFQHYEGGPVIVSSDGSRGVSCGSFLSYWNLDTATRITSHQKLSYYHANDSDVSLSPDQQSVLICQDDAILQVDLTSGQTLQKWKCQQRTANYALVSPNREWLAYSGPSEDVSIQEPRFRNTNIYLRKYQGTENKVIIPTTWPVSSYRLWLAFSPDSSQLISWTSHERGSNVRPQDTSDIAVCRWDLTTGHKLWSLRPNKHLPVYCAFTATPNRFLYLTHEGEYFLIDTESGKIVEQKKLNNNNLVAAALSPDSTSIAVEDAQSIITLYRLRDFNALATYNIQRDFPSAVFFTNKKLGYWVNSNKNSQLFKFDLPIEK